MDQSHRKGSIVGKSRREKLGVSVMHRFVPDQIFSPCSSMDAMRRYAHASVSACKDARTLS
jgi:hypothetical protein